MLACCIIVTGPLKKGHENNANMNKEILYRFFSGDATPGEQRQIVEWLDAAEENRHTFDRERSMYDALVLFAPAVPAIPKARPIPVWQRRMMRLARFAAVIAVAVGIGWGYVSHRERKWEMLATNIAVPAGQRLNITLQDGTSVWLNSGAEIEYPALFAGNMRRVKVRGEVLFDVARDERRPFIVETFACRVEVLGTRFNVDADERHGRFSTSLLRGSVQVTTLAEAQQVVLKPGEKVSLHNGQLVLEATDDPNEYLWTEGLISVKGLTFSELLHEFEHCYDVRFDVRLDPLPPLDAIGKIRISDGIDHALHILQRNSPFRYVHDDATNTITIY